MISKRNLHDPGLFEAINLVGEGWQHAYEGRKDAALNSLDDALKLLWAWHGNSPYDDESKR